MSYDLDSLTMKAININNISIGGGNSAIGIIGLCVIENVDHTLMICEQIKKTATQVGIPFIFKASYDKANRSSIDSYRGPGIKAGLEILANVKETFNVPILTDVHCKEDVPLVAEVADIIQIPAFLCRQTDLLIAVGKTGKPVNVKKGQFLSPKDIKNVISKIKSTGNEQIILTERGVSFGYNYLISDMRSLSIMREFGYPVIFDATHSVQIPGGEGDSSGGERKFVAPLARAAIAVGVDGVFMEVHDNPESAPSDGKNAIFLSSLKKILEQIKYIDEFVKEINHELHE